MNQGWPEGGGLSQGCRMAVAPLRRGSTVRQSGGNSFGPRAPSARLGLVGRAEHPRACLAVLKT